MRALELASALVLLVAGLALSACTGSRSSQAEQTQTRFESKAPRFVPAPKSVRNKCLATAREVGYPVPCPRAVPRFLIGVNRTIVATPSNPSWRGWVVGSSVGGDQQHLVITASPSQTSAVKLVNGPAWYPRARVRVLGSVVIRGVRREIVFVPAQTNDGSSFAHHVVLVWTVGRHTYGLGFHVLATRRQALTLDEELARETDLVGP
jgi:hypothetical protein